MTAVSDPFQRLVDIVARLRAPDGCPWDREQTPQSALPYLLEEAFEAAEAIDSGDHGVICEELGDLLLQVVFQTQMFQDTGASFAIGDVATAISDKLVRRHPHVFGDVKATTSDEVLTNWEAIKREEKPERDSMLEGIPKGLPSLLRAFRIGQKAHRVHFDWSDMAGVLAKVGEEVEELRAAHAAEDPEACDHELGDVLFALAQLARWMDLDPEGALRRANDRFASRFRSMERQCAATEREMKALTASEWNALWEEAKADEKP
jgi:tetrapyrrole methylase family protein / MazG family protein